MEVINFNKDKDVVKKLKEMTTYGPDVGIEAGDDLMLYLLGRSCKRQYRLTWQNAAVGCHYTKSWVHRLETTLMLETDSGDMINEIINAVRKVRRVLQLILPKACWSAQCMATLPC